MFVRMGGERGAAMGLDEWEHRYAVKEVAELTDARPVVIAEWPGSTVIGVAPGETTPQFRAALATALQEWRNSSHAKGDTAD